MALSAANTDRHVVYATGPGLSDVDARHYAGQWVALRDGRVIAAGRSRRGVARDRRVDRKHDALYKVPSADALVV